MSDADESNHPIKPELAAAQATEYLGFMGSETYDLGDGATWTLPNPQLMPPDMKTRYLEHLRSMSEDLDTVKQKNPITGEERDIPKYPPRIKGELINDEELLCKALMGDDETYKKFLKAGGVPGQIGLTWQLMERQLRERMKSDSKSS